MIVLMVGIGVATIPELHAAGAVAEEQPAQDASASAEQAASADSEGLSLITGRCTSCHGVDQIFMQRKNAEDWKDTVQKMIDRGTDVTEAEQEVITQYLIENYPI
jgi:mono/diheme cytochrome c family protein